MPSHQSRHRPALSRSARRGESGQGFVLLVVSLAVLLIFAAATVDVGMWLLEKRKDQTAADLGALSGTSALPAGAAAVQARNAVQDSKNLPVGGTLTYSVSASAPGGVNDTVTASAQSSAPT